MGKDINLDGTEISVVKAIGLGGGEISGEALVAKVPDLGEAELIDTLQGLVSVGYVDADSHAFHTSEQFQKTHFSVNSGYSRELRTALDPGANEKKPKSRRVRRE